MSKMKLYAFWATDDYFPYIEGGEVEEMDDRGRISPVGCEGYWFCPIKILPRKAGEELHSRIRTLECARIDALKQFNNEWERRIQNICSFKL